MIIFTYKDKKKKLQIYLRAAFENNFLFFKTENIENTFDSQKLFFLFLRTKNLMLSLVFLELF